MIDRFVITKGELDEKTIEGSNTIDANVKEGCVISNNIISFQGIPLLPSRWTLDKVNFFLFDDNDFMFWDDAPGLAREGLLFFNGEGSASSMNVAIGASVKAVTFKLFWIEKQGELQVDIGTLSENVNSDTKNFSFSIPDDLRRSFVIKLSSQNAVVAVYDLKFTSLCNDEERQCIEQCDGEENCDQETCTCRDGFVPPYCTLPVCKEPCVKCLDTDLCTECKEGFTGNDCEECADGWTNYPDCEREIKKECSSKFCSKCIDNEVCESCTSPDVVGPACDKCKNVGSDFAPFPKCGNCASSGRQYPNCHATRSEKAKATGVLIACIENYPHVVY